MTTDLSTIYARYQTRRLSRSPMLQRWAEIRDVYNGEIVTPLPELSSNEKAFIPNLLSQGVDQLGMRIASTLPDVTYPPIRPNIAGSVAKADARRKANLSWWTADHLDLKLGRRARHHVAYGMSVVHIQPDLDNHRPTWRLRNPLTAYPSTVSDPDQIHPRDCVFATVKSVDEIALDYPNLAARGAFSYGGWHADRWTVLEYVDSTETVSVVLGPALPDNAAAVFSGIGKRIINIEPLIQAKRGGVESYGKDAIELERVPNRANISPVIAAGRITLDRLAGMFDSIPGMHEMRARLMALEVIAVEQAIYQDLYFVEENQSGGGVRRVADGRKGIIGVIEGGTLLPITASPGAQTGVTLDRIERAERQNSALPAQISGESATNIRTGARGDSIFSATVDFHIQEAQKILAAALQEENRIAVAVQRAYFGTEAQSFVVNWNKAKGRADYTPDDIFTESDTNIVSFAHAGADVNSLTVGLGQLDGLGLISKKTSRQLHPMIDDPDFEEEQITVEQINSAVLAAFAQAANTGSVSLDDVAFFGEQVLSGKVSVVDGLKATQDRAQKRQASAGPPGTPEGPVAPGSPEAQPGLAAGTPAEAGAAQPTIGPPSASVTNLTDLVSQLHRANTGAQAGPSQGPPVPVSGVA